MYTATYIAGSITAITPRYCTKEKENALRSTKKKKENIYHAVGA
jgi:hypothetical protein